MTTSTTLAITPETLRSHGKEREDRGQQKENIGGNTLESKLQLEQKEVHEH